jgi:hypothetical protein
MKTTIAALATAFTLMASGTMISSAAAQVTGQYKVDGQNPDGSTYSGTSSVEKTGDTYRISWNIGGTRYTGTAIGDDDAIAIGYKSGSETGVTLLVKQGDSYVAVWAYIGARKLGAEKWTRR